MQPFNFGYSIYELSNTAKGRINVKARACKFCFTDVSLKEKRYIRYVRYVYMNSFSLLVFLFFKCVFETPFLLLFVQIIAIAPSRGSPRSASRRRTPRGAR